MTIEQQRELADLTQQAIEINDLESLQKIYDIILDDLKTGTIQGVDSGIEWFETMVPQSMISQLKS
jgi:hypothetical protein